MSKKKKKMGRPLRRTSPKAVRSTSINPYFRDKFKFRGKKVYFSREYATARSRLRSKLLNIQVRALSKLKPKKADRGKLLFYRVKTYRKPGKIRTVITRVRGEALLKTPVFVLKAGKKKFRILNPYDPKTLAKGVKPRPSAQPLGLLDVRRMRKKRIDYDQYLKQTEKLYRKKFISRPVTKTVLKRLKTRSELVGKDNQRWYTVRTPNGNLDPFYRAVIAIWAQEVKGQRKQLSWLVVGKARLSNGKIIDFDTEPLRSNRFFELTTDGLTRAKGNTKASRRVYSTPFMYDLYSRYMHSGLAGALGSYGYVTEGSVRRVQRRSYNYGKAKKDWDIMTTDNQRIGWPGRNKEPIQIDSISFTLRPSAR